MSDSTEAAADTLDATVLLGVLARLHEGDFTARMPLEWTGVAGKVADGLNQVIVANQATTSCAVPPKIVVGTL